MPGGSSCEAGGVGAAGAPGGWERRHTCSGGAVVSRWQLGGSATIIPATTVRSKGWQWPDTGTLVVHMLTIGVLVYGWL